MTSVKDIRKTFLNYYAGKGHEVVASSPLVPHNDPTLLFTNSGMVQFKNRFTGLEGGSYSRATTCQRSLRAGGKHNDLENVGYTARHHTFFEMLGNFSFGDYFKEQAIEFAWEVITKEFGLPKEKLLVTVFSEDDEAANFWKKIGGFTDDRIIRIPTSDNFWSMGDTGPCGPCSEIFFDHGDKIPGGPPGSADQDGDRFIEIWNLVFMQFEQVSPDKRINLPKPSIDTGMGLERLAAILQGKHDNYDIDLFQKLIESSAHFSKTDPYGVHKNSHRVIADHLRATSFLIVDGVLPSNEGRGYVLRRIMRRAMRHAHLLGCQEPLMHQLVQSLVDEMGEHYPELKRGQALVEETLLNEEQRFKKTLSRGLKLLDEELDQLGSRSTLSGETAFKLYDTFGFPLDLTQDILRGHGKQVDTAAFDVAMEKQREEARKSWVGSGESQTENRWFDLRHQFGKTEFLGYKTCSAEAAVLAICKSGEPIEKVSKSDDIIEIITNQTPFYGESGGQVGDIGIISGAKGLVIEVVDTQKKLGDLFVHYGKVIEGTLVVGDFVAMEVNQKNRNAIAANHSATHLLHAAFHEVLGDQVTQKGSLVNAEKLRFDVSMNQPIDFKTMRLIEAKVNEMIIQNAEVTTRLMPTQKAIEAGAMALFGEKYGDEVRVVTMGKSSDGKSHYSLELCGGTHVKRTGDIGYFKFISQSGLSAGVRRFEAHTGLNAVVEASSQEETLIEISDVLKAPVPTIVSRVQALVSEKKTMERELSQLRRDLSMLKGASTGSSGSEGMKSIQGVNFASRILEDVPAKELKSLVDELKSSMKSGVAAVLSIEEGKASLVVGVTDDLMDRFNAVDLVKAGAIVIGGVGGGGRPQMAQAGGPNGSEAAKAIATIETKIAELAAA